MITLQGQGEEAENAPGTEPKEQEDSKIEQEQPVPKGRIDTSSIMAKISE